MRKWTTETYGNLPKRPLSKRVRSEADIQITTVPITYGIDCSFSIRIYVPVAPEAETLSRPALIMFHGGGWMAGSAEGDDGKPFYGLWQCEKQKLMANQEIAKFFASELRAVVCNVDYRLAPEFPFPESHNDAYETLNWVISNASTYHINTERVGVFGISSGANLAAGIAHRDCAENQSPRIRHLNLVVPVTCHPKYYSPVMRSKEGSWRFWPDALDPHNSGLRIWGKLRLFTTN